MQSIDYEEKRRISNIVWTITGCYGKEVDTTLLMDDYFDRYELLYSSTVLGSLYFTLDYHMILDFVNVMKKSINVYKDVLYLFYVCVEETCINAQIDFIKNISNLRQKSYEKIESDLEMNRQKDRLYNSIRLCYFAMTLGEPMKFDKRLVDLILRVKKFRKITNTLDFIKVFVELINDFFKTEVQLTTDEKELSKENLQAFLQNQGKKNNKIFEFFDTYTSSEFNPNESVLETNFTKDSRVVNEKQTKVDESKNFSKMANYYGAPMYDIKTTIGIENKLVKGIHEGHKLFFTKADVKTITDSYRKEQIQEQIDKNKADYKTNRAIYENLIKKLKTIIQEAINQDNIHTFKSSKGNLVARLAYRADLLNDRKIFQKTKKQDLDTPVVDIVLDASASLIKKQSQISIQAYIVSKALQECGIENSVTSFNNFMDYSIIKLLKTYEQDDCKRCFDYYCSGGNRDGLAIDVIGRMKRQRSNSKRIMIVFTDAKPYDVQVIQEIGRRKKTPYQGDLAVNDTANTLRMLRYEDLNIFGIFSGEDKDMPVLRLIYGTDFVYIKSVDRFSDRVGEIFKHFMSDEV